MNSEKLSNRLCTVAKYVPDGARLADIGSDHAYLPCFLAKNNQINFAIAGEVVAGPFQSAEGQVRSEGLTERISVRMGDGLDVINPGEVDCITIAGMGGTLIANILDRGRDKLSTVKRLVLQPNISAVSIRKWFLENDWELVAEEILEEDGKIYEVLVGERGESNKPYRRVDQEHGLLFGPFLMEQKEPVFQKKWRLEKQNWERILKQLENAPESEETFAKKQEILNKLTMVEGVLKDEEA